MPVAPILLKLAFVVRAVYSMGFRYIDPPINSTSTNIPNGGVNSATISTMIEYQGKQIFLIATDNGKMERRVYLTLDQKEDPTASVCIRDFTSLYPPLSFAKLGTRLLFSNRTSNNHKNIAVFDAATDCNFTFTDIIWSTPPLAEVRVATMDDTTWMTNVASESSPFRIHSFSSGLSVSSSSPNYNEMNNTFRYMNNLSCLDNTDCYGSYNDPTVITVPGYPHANHTMGNVRISLSTTPTEMNFTLIPNDYESNQVHMSKLVGISEKFYRAFYWLCSTANCSAFNDDTVWSLPDVCGSGIQVKYSAQMSFDENNNWVAMVCTNNKIRVFKLYDNLTDFESALVFEKTFINPVLAVTFLKRDTLLVDLAVLTKESPNLKLNYFKAEECTVPNCAACMSNASRCDECQAPHIRNNVTFKCDAIYSCPSGSDLADCSTCFNNNYLNKADWECTNSCNLGYAKNSTRHTCEPCPLSCSSCTDDDFLCLTCSNGNYLHVGGVHNGTCFPPCVVGYTQSNSICTASVTCNANQYLNNSSCFPCNTSCATCSSSTACLTCPNASFLNNGICTACNVNCSTCNSSAGCMTCSASSPIRLPPTCEYFNCSIGCVDGRCNISIGECLECSTGYTLISGTCAVNTPIGCSANCTTCDTTTGVCEVCKPGTFLFMGNCSDCLSKCNTCINGGSCVDCKNTSLLTSNNCNKVDCDSSCSSSCNTAIGTCVACGARFYPSGNACLSCPTKCQTCNSSTGCMTCDNSSFYTPNCEQVNCSTNCINCNYGNGICSQCSSGYFLASGNCSPCLAGCSNCTNSNSCLTCASNNVSLSNCLPINCGPNCTSCNGSTGKCILCAQGYFNSNGNCTKCLDKCLACNSSTDCESCLNISYTRPNCMPANCPASCDQCDSNGSCTKCLGGYFLTASDNLCSKCKTKCGTCSNNATCDTCSTASPWAMPDCEAKTCADGCGSCNGTTGVCMACKSTHYLDGDKCIQCDANCLTCEAKSTHCLSCHDASVLDNSTNTCQRPILNSTFAFNGLTYSAETNTLALDFSTDLVSSDLDSANFHVAFTSLSNDEVVKVVRALGPKPPSALVWNSLPGFQSAPLVTSARSSGSKLRLVLQAPGSLSGGSAVVHISDPRVLEDKANPAKHFADFLAAGPYTAVISTGLDQTLAVVAPAVKTSLSILTLLMFLMNASQAFVLMKICQTLDFYIYLNVELPANFARFLDIVTSTPVDLVPNFLDTLVDDDLESDRDRFAAFGQTVNIFSNLGAFFTIACVLGILRLLTWIVATILKRLGGKTKIIGEKVSSLIGMETFYGLFEGYHLDEVLSMIVIITQGYRLRHRLGNKIFITVFVSLFSLFMISMYLFMGYTVRKLSQQNNKVEEVHDKKIGKLKRKGQSSILEVPVKQAAKRSCKQLVPLGILKSFEFWVEDKTENGNIFQRHFNLIQLFKDIVFAALLYALYYKPLVLIILLTLMQASYIYSMVKYPPYKAEKDSKLTLITQVIYIVLDVQFFVLVVTSSSQAVFRYYVIGFSMIVTVLCAMTVNIGFIFYQAWQDYKMRRAKRLAQESASNNGVKTSQTSELNEDSKLSMNQNDTNTSLISNKKKPSPKSRALTLKQPKATSSFSKKTKVSTVVPTKSPSLAKKVLPKVIRGSGKNSLINDIKQARSRSIKKKPT